MVLSPEFILRSPGEVVVVVVLFVENKNQKPKNKTHAWATLYQNLWREDPRSNIFLKGFPDDSNVKPRVSTPALKNGRGNREKPAMSHMEFAFEAHGGF